MFDISTRGDEVTIIDTTKQEVERNIMDMEYCDLGFRSSQMRIWKYTLEKINSFLENGVV
jgi:hypothetical protein